VGPLLYELALYRAAFPKASADEIRGHIARTHFQLYSRQDISDAEKRLGLTRKRGCTTANQALSAANLLKRQMFWNMPPPLGIVGTAPWEIDFDEWGMYVSWVNRK
jgi:hypothetical protein